MVDKFFHPALLAMGINGINRRLAIKIICKFTVIRIGNLHFPLNTDASRLNKNGLNS